MSKEKMMRSPLFANEDAAGNVMRELTEAEIDNVAGAGTANSYCACVSSKDSCGSGCTATTECPLIFSLFGCCG